MDLVSRVLLLVYSGTIDISEASVVDVGDFALGVLCCNALSVI